MSTRRALSRRPPTRRFVASGYAGATGAAGIAVVGALTPGCVPDAALQRDVANLRAELDASRRVNDDLRARLERLETRVSLLGTRPAPPKPAAATPAAPARAIDPLSDLPVVRLAPPSRGAAAAPPLDTRKSLQEPSNETWESLKAARDADKDDAPATVAPPDPAADAAWEAAFASYRRSEPEAVTRLVAFADAFPAHDSADNALHLAALSHVRAQRCSDAIPLLERAIASGAGKRAPSDAAGPAMLELGRCEADLGRTDAARTWFEKIVKQRPNTVEAAEALAALGDLRASETEGTNARP